MTTTEDGLESAIAVIGMAGRFPGASTLGAFWSNLRNGVESIRTLTEQELLDDGETLENIRDPAYVPAAAPLEDIDQFDAGLFVMSPRDAAIFDPQHRIFLECAFETFEHSGYVGNRIDGAVGVFASCGASDYMFKNVLGNARIAESVGEWLIRHTGNDSNFLATRASYEFNLRGPSLNVQTACSSTLVAIHLACQSILNGECDMALAGGAVVSPHQKHGYFYKEGEILSPDGHCRAFDAKSSGTVISSAAGCVLLKSYADAVDDGDNVLAIIRGSAINNDGNDKVGYLAPSIGGQARVIAEALSASGVDARDISYVEAHGTGTLIGDPIEIAGATEAFRSDTADIQFCAIGSLKSNIGHAGEAAGVAAFIKTVLALQHAEIPPSLHFEIANPQADLSTSPFFVNNVLRPWAVGRDGTRLAGVTGLGAGGTNAHIVLQEAPPREPSEPPVRPQQLIAVSARSAESLTEVTAELADHLRSHPTITLADVAYTRLEGRRPFRWRRATVATDALAAAALLESGDARSVFEGEHTGGSSSVVFMMPGGGAQYSGMAHDLYVNEPVFRQAIDETIKLVNPQLGLDLRSVLYPDASTEADRAAADALLERPSLALPAVFCTTYAMARLLSSWGVEPDAMIGHSAGEYVAACLAGVVTMPDALAMVALRGRLFETLPPGGMLSVPMSEGVLTARLPSELSLAAVNGPDLCVVSGPSDDLTRFEDALAVDEIESARIHIDVAAHSAMLDPILDQFAAFCRTISFAPPQTPYVSNLTGTWITAENVQDHTYWVDHLRHTVRFADGIGTILEDPTRVLIEIGPGRTLTSLAASNAASARSSHSTIRHPRERASDVTFALRAVAGAWASGVDVGAALFEGSDRHRLDLPTTPFEHARYWIDPDPAAAGSIVAGAPLRKRPEISHWFSIPTWHRAVPPTRSLLRGTTLVISDGGDLPSLLRRRLVQGADRLVTVTFARRFMRFDTMSYEVDPERSSDWVDLIDDLRTRDLVPDRIVHVSAVGRRRGRRRLGRTDAIAAFDATVRRDHTSLLHLASALSGLHNAIRLVVVTSGVHRVEGTAEVFAERALLHGACRVIPRELGHVGSVAVDLDLASIGRGGLGQVVDQLVVEIYGDSIDDVVVLSSGQRWVRGFEPAHLQPAGSNPWRSDGVYLITGGLGGIGLTIADNIIERAPGAALVLVGRTALPPRAEWDELLVAESTSSTDRRRIAAVRQLEEQGGRVLVITADVTDQISMTDAIARATDRFGRITGVVHTAGVLHDALIALRTPSISSPVVDVKAKGILVLDLLLKAQPPEFIVLCSSVSSVIGLPGQVDYTAANAFLDAYAAAANRRDGTRVIAVNWNAWQQVGMAVDTVATNQARSDRDPDPSLQRSSTQLFDDSAADADRTVFATQMSRSSSWLLSEHVARGGNALLPGTGFAELVRSAVAFGRTPQPPIEIRDLYFLAPFSVGPNEEQMLSISYDHSSSTVTVYSDSESSPHATATASVLDAQTLPQGDIDQIRQRCGLRVEEFDGYSDQPFMEFGPRWGSLRRVEYGEGEALVTAVMPQHYRTELDDLWLHPALLDILTGSAQAIVPGFDQSETFYVPFSYRSLISRGPIPPVATSHVRAREVSSSELAVFDVAVYDEDGNEIVTLEGFTMRRVDATAGTLTARPAGPGHDGSRPTELPISAAVREGITPPEGADALDRILSVDLGPQVVASSVDLAQWIVNVDAEAASVGGNLSSTGIVQFERRDMDAPFVGPATPIEIELAAMWGELLGLDRVGRNDDFFELGGQSLIAVRLFTRIRKRYSIDLELSSLFEAPTIAECARIIAERLGVPDAPIDDAGERDGIAGGAGDENSGPGRDPPSQPTFRAIVTIQKGGDRVPFFCVHGAGGNVLNFRDLSLAMGHRQPFYGIQAYGIDGVSRPLESIEAMATAYLDEVRAIQLHGPYTLGGYSGGGLVAFEMAQQLAAVHEEVSLVVLLDTFPPIFEMRRPTLRSSIERLRAERSEYLRQIVNRRIALRRAAQDEGRLQSILDAGGTVPTDLREQHLEASFGRAASRYVRRPWSGRVVLLRATDVAFSFQELGDSYGWDDVVTDGFELVRVPGDHNTLVLEPNASRLVDLIRDSLDERLEPFISEVV